MHVFLCVFASAVGPDSSVYQYDEASGYYYDPQTGLYYDPSSQVCSRLSLCVEYIAKYLLSKAIYRLYPCACCQ